MLSKLLYSVVEINNEFIKSHNCSFNFTIIVILYLHLPMKLFKNVLFKKKKVISVFFLS